jgi:hypothetical protein
MIGLALIIVIAIAGSIRKPRGPRYWIFCAAAAAYFAFLGPFLFYAGGTLDNPAADGVITRAVRAATSDGPLMGFWAIAVLLALYGGTAWLLVSAIREHRRELPSATAPEIAPPVAQIKAAELLPPPDERFRDAQERPLTARQRSLSGWARLWIVIAALFWLVGAGTTFYMAREHPCPPPYSAEGARIGTGTGPLAHYSNHDLCELLFRRGGIDTETANSMKWRRTLNDWAVLAGIAIGIWLVAMMAKSLALWVWRGFRPNIKPGAN